MDRDKRPRSLKEFDYFNERPEAIQSPVTPFADGAPMATPPRAFAGFMVTTAFLGVSVWFLAGYFDAAAYAYSEPRAPLDLGDVTALVPAQIPHNAYVTVHGITEHRALHQVMLRGLGLSRQDFWYFRLVGSRGVFVEVPPDASKYGIATEVTVTGRAIDPRQAPLYRALLRSYADTFGTELSGQTRIVQAGMQPGAGRWFYAGALAVLGGLAAANVVALTRLLKSTLRR